MKHRNRQFGLIALAVATGAVAGSLVRRSRGPNGFFRGKVVVITGGSRGLGLALARHFAADGAKLVLCARSQSELRAATQDLRSLTSDVLAIVCDVSKRDQVQRLMETTVAHYGGLDILVNNAGVIKVGPVQSMTQDDFAEAMDTMFWGVVHTTLAAMPLLERSQGTVVNVTSVGGKVPVPHLLPYCCAKYATVAFSEGLRMEVRGLGVEVLTVAPSLMRTGSHTMARFKGDAEGEAAWFGFGASFPGISMSANRAARETLLRIQKGGGDSVLGMPAVLLSRFHALFPGLSAQVLEFVNKALPGGVSKSEVSWNLAAGNKKWLRALTFLGRGAAREFLQPSAT